MYNPFKKKKTIRLWNLGSLEHKIVPTAAACKRLSEILNQKGGPPVDLIWGPDLTCTIVEGDADVIQMCEHSATLYLRSKGYKVVGPSEDTR